MAADFDYTRIPDLPDSIYVAPLKKTCGPRRRLARARPAEVRPEQHRIWDELYARQMELMPGHACREFMHGLERLDLGPRGRAGFQHHERGVEEPHRLDRGAGADVDPDHVFYYHLANRRFPAAISFARASSSTTSRTGRFPRRVRARAVLTNPDVRDTWQRTGAAGGKALSTPPEGVERALLVHRGVRPHPRG